ncbi:hypothetical protein ASC61_15960 [Aeromicrobium sp. Root344]|uniref:LpqN/LpqT family lipoprotein n=1 Tax=Aeromicrobium sp. Root344 TaxID=1736521 RepID=UPI0006F96A90|nr:LpqN/LpqT family lipoprotein [Aeromicrobium sp. Root344]KQV76378.1 hypothetical protein ASC61_15960 [Aeromicrobium sp. Root344]
MKLTRRSVATAGIALTVALTLGACGGSDDPKSDPAPTKSSAKPSPSASASTPTVADYIKQSGATETALTREDSDGVTVDLPVPDGWETTKDYGDAGSYGAIVYKGAADPANPPHVLALFSKLEGNVEAAKILEYAPQELKNLEGFKELSPASPSKLGGYDAVQYGGTVDVKGTPMLIAQKTVVVPAASGGLYVLQLNAYATQDEVDVLTAVMNDIDSSTTIS